MMPVTNAVNNTEFLLIKYAIILPMPVKRSAMIVRTNAGPIFQDISMNNTSNYFLL